jgi:hypothetical protein
MSKRLQVLIEEAEYRQIQRVARSRRMTVAEWVRNALRLARDRESPADPGRKLEAVRASLRHSYPVGEIDEMLAEIERGYVDRSQG